MSQTPLLIVGDAPSSHSGLGRIVRDISSRVVENLSDTFRLATIGYGGVGSTELPWQQYSAIGDPPNRGWFLPELYVAWKDFAKDEKGVVLTIWDPSRMLWMTEPNACPDPTIRAWLAEKPFQLWGYWPIDAEGVNHCLPRGAAQVMAKYDRNLAYSEWAKTLMANSGIKAESLPHGIDTSVWHPCNKQQARKKCRQMGLYFLEDESLLIGICATNQARKNWALAFETAVELMKAGKDVYLWCHVDAVHRHWDIAGLAKDFDMTKRVLVTLPEPSDEELAWLYSACDATLGIGMGEGWGMILAESLACGVPVVHGNYGGGSDFLPKEMLVEPIGFYYDGVCRRPVFSPKDWADTVLSVLEITPVVPEYIKWENAWHGWSAWLTKGVADDRSDTLHAKNAVPSR